MNETKQPQIPHAVTLTERSRMQISGVSEVISFDEASVSLSTVRGGMTIEGRDLHITTLNIDRGEVVLDGTVDGVFYTGDRAERPGFLGRLFG